MIRVHCPPLHDIETGPWPYLGEDTTYHDFEEATAAAVTADGSLILTRVEVRIALDGTGQPVIDRATGQFQKQISNPQLVAILPAGMWGPVEAFDDEPPVGGELQA